MSQQIFHSYLHRGEYLTFHSYLHKGEYLHRGECLITFPSGVPAVFARIHWQLLCILVPGFVIRELLMNY